MTMATQTDTVTLPAYWAPALINGDFSGLEDDPVEAARCRAIIREYEAEGWGFVGCEDEPRFTWNYDLYDPGATSRGGDVLEYTISRQAK
jgi:hypothetical protein